MSFGGAEMKGRQGEKEMTESTQPPGTGEDGADVTSLVVIRTSVDASKTVTIADTYCKSFLKASDNQEVYRRIEIHSVERKA
ncbi:hypothetical protein L2E82_45787 [Cichorium intybus]|uniref:Uncharacterized protein n=1 Tax=Cichorium intybus TaxID=13427 RepID=A0ACB8ZUA1_CICIN|nr:hypothetical protein L2E82_45787 [Cichorium intybus]